MKTAADYVAAACATPFRSPAGPTIPLAAAEAAVQQALDDAEKYRQLLARATRNATLTTPNTGPAE